MDNSEIEEIKDKLGEKIHLFSDKVILIAGCLGSLGKIYSHLFIYLNQFLEKPCKVIGIDNFIVGLPKLDIQDKNFIFFNHDICLPLDEKIKGRIDFVINVASIADPNVYIKYPEEVLRSSLAQLHLLKLANDRGAESVLLFSSSEIIGGFQSQVPTPELDYCCYKVKGERAAYDQSKSLTITVGDIWYRHYGLNVKYILPFNIYSSNMSLQDKRMIPSFISQILKNEPILIFGDGLETRTLCHSIDFIYATLLVLLFGKPNEHLNVGNDSPELSVRDTAQLVIDIIGRGEIKHIEAPEVYKSQPKRRCPNINKIKQLGYLPSIPIEEGIRRYWNFVNKNV